MLTNTGALDLTAAADTLAERLPEPLEPLATLAYNYLWSWTPGGDALFADLDQQRWGLCARNPVRVLHEVSHARLGHLAVDRELSDADAQALGHALAASSRGPRPAVRSA